MTRTVIITGASSGIGREAARELAKGGADVAVVGRNPDRTRAVADEVGWMEAVMAGGSSSVAVVPHRIRREPPPAPLSGGSRSPARGEPML